MQVVGRLSHRCTREESKFLPSLLSEGPNSPLGESCSFSFTSHRRVLPRALCLRVYAYRDKSEGGAVVAPTPLGGMHNGSHGQGGERGTPPDREHRDFVS